MQMRLLRSNGPRIMIQQYTFVRLLERRIMTIPSLIDNTDPNSLRLLFKNNNIFHKSLKSDLIFEFPCLVGFDIKQCKTSVYTQSL